MSLDLEHKLYNINGYYILLLNNNENNNYYVKAIINNGYINENSNNLGINHLLEHVLINSNPLCKHDCISEMNVNGIKMNATTGLFTTTYYTIGLKSDLNKMINFIVDSVLNNNNFTEKTLNSEKNAVLNELLIASNNNQLEILNELFKKTFNQYGLKNFFNYKKQIENLKTLKYNDLLTFYRNNYKNILFTISGNLDNNNVINLIKNKLKNNKIQNFLNDHKYFNNCFNNGSIFKFIKNDKLSNTVFYINFKSKIDDNVKNSILINIITSYFKNLCLYYLRSKKKLIYNINISSNKNYCGTLMEINLNVSNENAKKTINYLFELINNSYKNIYMKFIEGIKKFHLQVINQDNFLDKVLYYENMYINNLFNKSKEKIYDISEYSDILLNINEYDIINILPKLFNFNNMVLIYSSKKKI